MEHKKEVQIIPAKKRKPTVIRVGIYARVSTSRAEQLRSLANQVSSLTRHVYERYDWVLRDVYIDVGSAKTGSSRREFERMIEDCKSGKLDYILVKSPSRFGRDSLEVIESVRTILDAGVKLYFEANDLKIESTNNELDALDLKVKSPDNVWKREIEIFRNRIEGRYIVPMDHGTERREAS